VDPKKPARVTTGFGPEPKTTPSPSSGNYRARPVIVEEVTPHPSELRRRISGAQIIPPPPEPDDAETSEGVATPRPRVNIHSKPRIVKYESELVDLPLDPRAAFLLGLIDGKSRVQTLVDMSGMEESDVIELLERLLVFGVIALE
jgi:hypothetical protein